MPSALTAAAAGTILALMSAVAGAPRCEIEVISIVLAGSFNPAILQPQWLARHKLVRDSDADQARIEIIKPEVVSYTVGPFTVRGMIQRVSFEVTATPFQDALRDLVAGTFSLLSETPVVAVGINRSMHFATAGVGAWNAVGHALAPKQHWAGIVEDPGMLSLTIKGKPPGRPHATLHVSVEPSALVPNGVFLSFNEETNVTSAAEALARVESDAQAAWDHAFARALEIVRLGEHL